MIGISKLYCGTVEPSDALRYHRHSSRLPSHLLQFSRDKKPVVVWNVTRQCNLNCMHCYASAKSVAKGDEMTTAQGKEMLQDLASFGVPVILFSGGEPLMRKDLLDLIVHARHVGMRAVISTNGTLIDKRLAESFKKTGLSYVGISLDGLEGTHDRFRRQSGAFQKALTGIRNCLDIGVKVGIRCTISRHNVSEIGRIFDLLEAEQIPRICFYHLVYSGRGGGLMAADLDHGQTRFAVDTIIEQTRRCFKRGFSPEVLTVDNHTDGPYLYLRMRREANPRAENVMRLLQMNGGNSSGVGIGCVSWDGAVYADQFWRHRTFGSVLERPFSEIWMDTSNPLMAMLKDKKLHVKGRCRECRFLSVCGGNFRVRAEAVYGDPWAEDPACYLTDEEIGLP